jgi:hypothetical protein
MLWPDFKFGSPTFNELTFDHWIIVESNSIVMACLTGRFPVLLGLAADYPSLNVLIAPMVSISALTGSPSPMRLLAGQYPAIPEFVIDLEC